MRYNFLQFIVFILFTSLFLHPFKNNAQNNIEIDTVFVKAGNSIIFNDTSFILPHDTILFIPDTMNVLIGRTGSKFYMKLKNAAQKNKLTRELYRLAFRAPKRTNQNNAIATRAETPFIPYEGKTIRNINIKRLPIFGPTIADTTREAITWIGKSANKLHHTTRQWVIKQNLLFKPGDKVNPYLLAENSSVLRRLRYIDDATILIIPIGNDSVDIQVLTKDIFPLTGSVQIDSPQELYLEGKSVNILGLGLGFDNAFSANTERREKVRYDLSKLSFNNVLGSFINTNLQLHNNDDSLTHILSANRSIIPLKFDYFGGLKLYSGRWKYPLNNPTEDSLRLFKNVHFNEYDLFFGRSFINREKKTSSYWAPLIKTIAIRYQVLNYFNRPKVSVDTNFRLQKHTNLFTSACISKQDYFTTSYFYEFGRTEDIPYGYQCILTGGYQFGEFFDRSYLSGQIKFANVFPKIGYLFGKIELGGYIRAGKFEQGVLNFKQIFATNALKFHRSRIRIYSKATYTLGINRLDTDTIYLEEIHGFPTIDYGDFPGIKRFTFSPEINVFTPWYFYGFRFSLFAFSDFAWIGFKDRSVFENKTHIYAGTGIRFKNENLIFETIQLGLSYFINAPPGDNPFAFMVGTIQTLKFPQFLPDKPAKLGYK
ncbi:MAG: hypothetical protein ACEPOW_05065 [Bacteroidales bacterium]